MILAFGSDHAGYRLKRTLFEHAAERGYECVDLGCHSTESCDYPDFAHAVARAVLDGTADRGVVICGTGIGSCMAANRHAGIRAALCTETFAARATRAHNDANVLCMGERVVGEGVAKDIFDTWMATEFDGGRHVRRIKKIELDYEAGSTEEATD